MKKINVSLAAFFLLLVVTSSTILAAPDSAGKDDSKPTIVMRLVERAQDVAFHDVGASGPTLGDRLVFTSDLFDQDEDKVGRDGADCVIVRLDLAAPPAEQQIVQCTITVELADGQITFQGLAQGTENLFAVTGGTGAYRTVRGEAFAQDTVPLQEANITIKSFSLVGQPQFIQFRRAK